MGRGRDSQRQRVYDAERDHSQWMNAIYSENGRGWTTTGLTRKGDTETVLPIPEVSEIEDYFKKIFKSRWFKNRWPMRAKNGFAIKDGRRRQTAWGATNGNMGFPRWSRFDLFYCHELAHVVTSGANRSHGRVFCYNYLTIVKFAMGKEVADELKECFKKHRVKYTLPAGEKPTRLHKVKR